MKGLQPPQEGETRAETLERMLTDAKRLLREAEQLIVDIESYNDNNPAALDCPIRVTLGDRLCVESLQSLVAQLHRLQQEDAS